MGREGLTLVDVVDDDMLGLLLAAGGPDGGSRLSDTEVADQVLVFLLAGYETTAPPLTGALHELARSPRWQQAVRDEVAEVADGWPMTGADLPFLVVTDRAVREALRLYPSAHTVDDGPLGTPWCWATGCRRARSSWCRPTSSTGRRGCGRTPSASTPTGSTRTASPGRTPAGTRHAWMPFGAGPHTCVGGQLAMVEATLVLATVVRAVELTTDRVRMPVVPGIALRPAGPVPLTVAADVRRR